MNTRAQGSSGSHSRGHSLSLRIAFTAVLVGVLIAFELLIIWITQIHGATTTGDEPWYLIASQALWHLHPAFLSDVATDFRHHTFSVFPRGWTINTPHTVQDFKGPHGTVGVFEPGLPLILAPFFNIGGQLAARIGLMTIEVSGLVYLHRRVSLLAGLSRRSALLLALMFAVPAALVATTQIYPDFISGIVLACAAIELAIAEIQRRLTKMSAVVIAISIAVLPWFQVKNLIVSLILILSWSSCLVESSAHGIDRPWSASQLPLRGCYCLFTTCVTSATLSGIRRRLQR
jgi:hypothetical protein